MLESETVEMIVDQMSIMSNKTKAHCRKRFDLYMSGVRSQEYDSLIDKIMLLALEGEDGTDTD